MPPLGRIRPHPGPFAPSRQTSQGPPECERRFHRVGPSCWIHRSAARANQPERAGASPGETRAHFPLCRWWTRRRSLVGKELRMTTLEAPAPKQHVEDKPAPEPKPPSITRYITDEQICILTFDRPNSAANVFNRATLDELDSHLDFLTGDEHVRGVVIVSAKPSIFIAGADIKSFADGSAEAEMRDLIELGQSVFNRLSVLRVPSVAAIHGACLGGGYEICLACTYRIASPDKSTKI